jgi:hypothetical protein
MAKSQKVNRVARSAEELKPLLALCRAGRLFDVQTWIAAGKPLDPPDSGRRTMSPLEVAIDLGFHSLAQVLLEGGACPTSHHYNGPMRRALEARRLDMIRLLIEHGYDPTTVDMEVVFQTWDPEIMEFFIDRGADVETGRPLASALCSRIQTALRVLKRYHERFPCLQEQADIALRYHCREGNLKWVSLMLWAGADPYAPGPDRHDADWEDEEDDSGDHGICALAYAVLYEHYEVFDLKQVRLDPTHPSARDIARYAFRGKGVEILERLVEAGLPINDQENGGSSLLQGLLEKLGWACGFRSWNWPRDGAGINTTETREGMRAVDLLARHGAKWIPKDKRDMNDARKSLLKLIPDYTVRLVAILVEHRTCTKEALQSLWGTPSIKSHAAKYAARINNLIASLS